MRTVATLVCLCGLSAGLLSAQTVLNTNDAGPGSLRQAILDAAPGAEVTFDAGVVGTILLTGEELVIGKNLTVTGPGATVLALQNSNDLHRVFKVLGPATVSISGLTIRDTFSTNRPCGSHLGGGGLCNEGTLTLDGVVVTGNRAADFNVGGGLINTGTLTLNQSTVSENSAGGLGGGTFGGGLYNTGSATLNGSKVIANFGGTGDTPVEAKGIGIYNEGVLEINHSTIAGNTLGAGFTCGSEGAGIFSGTGTLTLNHTTVSGNRINGGAACADPPGVGEFGAGLSSHGTLALNYSTVTGNVNASPDGEGGGIWGSATLFASIVAGNVAVAGPDLFDPAPPVQGLSTLSLGYNIIGEDTGANIMPGPGDQIGTAGAALDPGLHALADNGGPTPTHALKQSSIARDALPAAACTAPTDQRGEPRPADGDGTGPDDCDVGAFEAQSPLPVELADVQVRAAADGIHLAWHTHSETDNAGFAVQWRQDPVGASASDMWQTAAFVGGAGTTTSPRAYRYHLVPPAPGGYAVRLRQVDFDGGSTYSRVYAVAWAGPAQPVLGALYPHPFQRQARFTFSLPHTQPVRITLVDVLGRVVRTLHAGPLAGGRVHPFTLSGADLPAGWYSLRVDAQTFHAHRALLKR